MIVAVQGLLLLMAAGLPAAATSPSTAPSRGPATTPAGLPADQLIAHLDAMKHVTTLSTGFVCEKRLAALQSPLVSSGTVWISRPDSVRFSTTKPYLSDLILHQGQILARDQHDKRWVKGKQSDRPGLAVIMGQMVKWSLGDSSSVRELYTVSAASLELPPRPGGRQADGDSDTASFQLTPRDKTLAEAVQSIVLAVDVKSHVLRLVRLNTTQGDQTTYWFDDVRLNVKLPPDAFAPEDAK